MARRALSLSGSLAYLMTVGCFSRFQVAMSIQTAAETNSPIGPLLAELVTTSTPHNPTSFVSHEKEEEEELVRALVSSLPARVLANGVETRQQLEERFAAMKGNLGLLALLPSNGGTDEKDVGSGGRSVKESGGVLSYLVASLASRLKVSERFCFSPNLPAAILSTKYMCVHHPVDTVRYAHNTLTLCRAAQLGHVPPVTGAQFCTFRQS